MAVESTFLHVIISLGVLLFAAKIMADVFHKVKPPAVLVPRLFHVERLKSKGAVEGLATA